jgi:cytochrome c oxidase assembly protein subunit 15
LLVATLFINLLSSYIRHHEAGLGCEDWPACYGMVGEFIVPPAEGTAGLAALTPSETAKRAHRAIATALVILVLLVVYQARGVQLPGAIQYLPYGIVALILLLSVIGPASYLKTLPAIATANLAGGMTLLSLVWWLWLENRPAASIAAPQLPVVRLKGWAMIALVMLIAQILLGAWVSANFAATACSAFLTCEAGTPQASLSSFFYFRELQTDNTGRVLTDQTQVLIQQVHHIGAALTTMVLSAFSVVAIRAGGLVRRRGVAILILLITQLALGLSALFWKLPLLVVLGHNLIASLLLLAVIQLLVASRANPA